MPVHFSDYTTGYHRPSGGKASHKLKRPNKLPSEGKQKCSDVTLPAASAV